MARLRPRADFSQVVAYTRWQKTAQSGGTADRDTDAARRRLRRRPLRAASPHPWFGPSCPGPVLVSAEPTGGPAQSPRACPLAGFLLGSESEDTEATNE